MLHKFNAKDFMSAHLVSLRPEHDVLDAIQLLIDKDVPGAPVLDGVGEIIGWLSEKDCLKTALNAGYDQSSAGKVADLMSNGVITVDAEDSIVEVAERFLSTPHKCFPVVEDNRLIGQITRRDVLRAIQSMGQGE